MIQPYKFIVSYKPGAGNPADYISRHLMRITEKKIFEGITERYVNNITKDAVPKCFTYDEIKKSTENDPELQQVLKSLKTGNWNR